MAQNNEFKILMCLGDEGLENYVKHNLSEFFLIKTVEDSQEACQLIHSFAPTLIVLDYSVSKIHPIDLYDGISLLHSFYLAVCVSRENLEVAKRAWSRRSIDYILKPIEPDRLVFEINKLVRSVFQREEIKTLKQRINELEEKLKNSK